MQPQKLLVRWWPPLAITLLFCVTASLFLPYPGIQNDEVLFADPLYRPDAAIYRIGIFGHSLPLMHLTYLGSLNTWLYAPIFTLWQPGWASVRIPAVLLGAVTVALFCWLLHAAHGARAAWTGGLLLATDTLFVLTTSFDWGPVVLQHLLLVAGMVALVQFHRTGKAAALALGWFCFGLGMWDKALFAWTLGGVAVAGGFVFHRELWKRLTWRNAAVAGAAFCLGALPLIAYNLNSNLATARGNATITPQYFGAKLEMLRDTWAGTALFGYLVNHDTAERPRASSGALEETAFRVRSVFGEHGTNRLEAAVIVALLLLPLLWFTPARRTLMFSLLAFVVAWLQMAFTKNAGLAAHHTVLLWPLAYLFLGVAFAEASLHVGRAGRWLLGVGVLYLVAFNLLLTNQYFYQIARDGPAGSWTDAIFALSDRVGGRPLLVTDWGILNPLEVLHQGRLNLRWAGDVDARLFADREALWVDHTDGNEQFAGRNKLWADAAAAAGYRKVVVETVADRNGRMIFELFRWSP
jgi:hypothetical protein